MGRRGTLSICQPGSSTHIAVQGAILGLWELYLHGAMARAGAGTRDTLGP